LKRRGLSEQLALHAPKNAEVSFVSIMNCHPEARPWPKDLPEYFRLDCCVLGSLARILVKEPGKCN